MSWNKNTIFFSQIDETIRALKDLQIAFKLDVIGEVRGLGLNDGDDKMYQIRKLRFIAIDNKPICLREQMIRTPDCDDDDILVSIRCDPTDAVPLERKEVRTE